MDPVQVWFVDFLRAEMEDRNLTQADLAWRTGYTQKHVSELFNGRTQGTLTAWGKLFTVVGLPPEKFVMGLIQKTGDEV
jgi:antitoxin component HigA of HigAB toxin-antitoxin module